MKTNFEYRLYYDETGVPTRMSVNEELPGRYIRISKALYNKPNYSSMRVIDGKLTRIDTNTNKFLLEKKEVSKYRSAKNHAGILTDAGGGQYYGFKYN